MVTVHPDSIQTGRVPQARGDEAHVHVSATSLRRYQDVHVENRLYCSLDLQQIVVGEHAVGVVERSVQMTTESRNSDMTLLLCVADIVTAIRVCVVLLWVYRKL